ncbi:unnamed protein product, partial [Pelagomonas calceolata]
LDWAARRPVLGVHVRRGDTCLDGGRGELRKHKGRTCDGLAAYAARARAMVDAHGFRAVFLATDDPQIVAEAQRTNAFGVPVLAPGGVENASFSSPCVAAVGPNSVFTRRRRPLNLPRAGGQRGRRPPPALRPRLLQQGPQGHARSRRASRRARGARRPLPPRGVRRLRRQVHVQYRPPRRRAVERVARRRLRHAVRVPRRRVVRRFRAPDGEVHPRGLYVLSLFLCCQWSTL